jgi:hypothetical protein
VWRGKLSAMTTRFARFAATVLVLVQPLPVRAQRAAGIVDHKDTVVAVEPSRDAEPLVRLFAFGEVARGDGALRPPLSEKAEVAPASPPSWLGHWRKQLAEALQPRRIAAEPPGHPLLRIAASVVQVPWGQPAGPAMPAAMPWRDLACPDDGSEVEVGAGLVRWQDASAEAKPGDLLLAVDLACVAAQRTQVTRHTRLHVRTAGDGQPKAAWGLLIEGVRQVAGRGAPWPRGRVPPWPLAAIAGGRGLLDRGRGGWLVEAQRQEFAAEDPGLPQVAVGPEPPPQSPCVFGLVFARDGTLVAAAIACAAASLLPVGEDAQGTWIALTAQPTATGGVARPIAVAIRAGVTPMVQPLPLPAVAPQQTWQCGIDATADLQVHCLSRTRASQEGPPLIEVRPQSVTLRWSGPRGFVAVGRP